MKQTIQNILHSIPPTAMFVISFVSVVAFGVVKLLALLRDVGMGA